MNKSKKKPKVIATCHMCRSKTSKEFYCYGCSVYVCCDCDKTTCTGKHVPADHLRITYGTYNGE